MVDALGFDARGPYLDFVALGRLGPTAACCLRLLAYGLAAHPAGYEVTPGELGRQLGLGPYTGRSSHLARTIERLETFGMARASGPDAVQVRRRIPPLTNSQLARLSPVARDVHRMMSAARDAERESPHPDSGRTAERRHHHLHGAEREAGLGR